MNTDVWLLLSGGVDSTACAHYFKQRGDKVTAIYVDFGQPAARPELLAVHDLTSHMKIPLTILTFRTHRQFGPGEIIGRNAFLIFSAIMGLQPHAGVISLGLHAGTTYYDCGPDFVQIIGKAINSYSSGRLALHCPFLRRDKMFMYQYAKRERVPLHLTYSCEAGSVPSCGLCLSCEDRNVFQIS